MLARLEAGDSDIRQMVKTVYAAVDERLHPAAALSMLAHLQDLTERGIVTADTPPSLDSVYRLA